MDDTPSTRELRIPAGLLALLRESAGAAAMTSAGAMAGGWVAEALREALGTRELAEVPTSAFWSALDEVLRSRGWGTLRAERLHAGIGVVVAEGWGEAEGWTAGEVGSPGVARAEGARTASPGCPFTAGLLSALFSQVAGAPVQVLELSCHARGEAPACRFAYGSETALAALTGALEAGHSEEAALVRI